MYGYVCRFLSCTFVVLPLLLSFSPSVSLSIHCARRCSRVEIIATNVHYFFFSSFVVASSPLSLSLTLCLSQRYALSFTSAANSAFF